MKVLIACEYSGIVRDAFIERGYDAMSCDLLPTERPGPHYQGDVFDIIGDGWDLMIGFPPCTHIACAGGVYFEQKRNDGRQRDAILFFIACYALRFHILRWKTRSASLVLTGIYQGISRNYWMNLKNQECQESRIKRYSRFILETR